MIHWWLFSISSFFFFHLEVKTLCGYSWTTWQNSHMVPGGQNAWPQNAWPWFITQNSICNDNKFNLICSPKQSTHNPFPVEPFTLKLRIKQRYVAGGRRSHTQNRCMSHLPDVLCQTYQSCQLLWTTGSRFSRAGHRDYTKTNNTHTKTNWARVSSCVYYQGLEDTVQHHHIFEWLLTGLTNQGVAPVKKVFQVLLLHVRAGHESVQSRTIKQVRIQKYSPELTTAVETIREQHHPLVARIIAKSWRTF